MLGPRRRRWWPALRLVVGTLLGVLGLYALNGDRGELVDASAELAHLRVLFVVAAVGFEILSLVSYAYLQRRLLACAEVRVGLAWTSVMSFAALTIASSIPAGPAFSSVYSYRQLRRRGADETVAGWTLLVTFVCAALGLALLATAGVLLATSESASYDLGGVILGVLVVTVMMDAVVWQRQWLARVATAVLSVTRRVVHRPRREASVLVAQMLAQLAAVRIGWRDLGVTVLAGFCNWAFDCACLACGFLAVGAPVPWRGLLLAYGAGQLAQNLPVTPGGLGVVEGSLTIALVAFGGAEVQSVAAVLLYRIVTFWAYLPLGWVDWGLLRAWTHRAELRAAAGGRAGACRGAGAGGQPAAEGATAREAGAGGQPAGGAQPGSAAAFAARGLQERRETAGGGEP